MTHTCSRLCPAQGLQEAIVEHKPLVGKLRRITTWLAEQCPLEAAPLWQKLQATEEQYGSLRERAQQATAVLGKALPRYSRVSQVHHPPVAVLQRGRMPHQPTCAQLGEQWGLLPCLRGAGFRPLPSGHPSPRCGPIPSLPACLPLPTRCPG